MILPTNRRKKGFTVIELLVVMVITGLILGLSVAGFVVYNQNTTLQAAQNDFITLFRTIRNSAQNTSVQVDPATVGSPNTQVQYVYYYTIDLQQFPNPERVEVVGSYCINRNAPSDEFTLNPTVQPTILSYLMSQAPTTTCIPLNGEDIVLKGVTFSTSPPTTNTRIIFQTVNGKLLTQTNTDLTLSFTKGTKSLKLLFQNQSNGSYTIL